MKSPPVPFTAALCPPAVRCVLVHAWSTAGEADVELLPVLALTTYDDGDGGACLDAVVADQGGYGVVASRHMDCCNSASLVVPAPWHPAEDETRLAGAIERVKAEAVEAERRTATPKGRPLVAAG